MRPTVTVELKGDRPWDDACLLLTAHWLICEADNGSSPDPREVSDLIAHLIEQLVSCEDGDLHDHFSNDYLNVLETSAQQLTEYVQERREERKQAKKRMQ